MNRDERGAISAFVIVFTFALLLVAGLVIDGGYLLAARREAINEAEAAARAGAQAVRSSTNTGVQLDPTRATRLADAYLAATGHTGTVSVAADTVTVEVAFERPMTILGLGGLVSTTVHGSGVAHGLRAVNNQGDL